MAATLIRRDPFDMNSFDRVVSRLLSEPFFVAPGAEAIEEGALALDVSEDEKNVIVRASLPGFTRQDVQVEVHDNVLVIKAEHTEQKEEKGERFYRKERRTGSLSRRIALPSVVNESEAAAELKDGVLTLRLPKARPETPRRITVN